MTNHVEIEYAGGFPALAIVKMSDLADGVAVEDFARQVRQMFPDETKIVIHDEDVEIHTVEQAQGDFGTYDLDPEAVAWGRAKVEGFVAKMRNFQQMATDVGGEQAMARADQWRKIANLVEMLLIGGQGCAIAAFDERLPFFAKMLDDSQES